MTTTKRADSLTQGDVLLRFGARCKVLSAVPARHPFLASVIHVTHCNADESRSETGEINLPPSLKVEVEA